MSDEPDFEDMLPTMKKAAGALRDADVPFLLTGGLAAWALGGPESDHDVDFLLKREDADRALDVLEKAGMRPDRPPEGWLYKAWDGDVFVDLIFHPTGMEVTDETIERGHDMQVYATPMRVAALEDILVTKLLSINDQEIDYGSVVAMARAVREQVDWDDVRRRTAESPYAKAFFTLVEELGVVPRAEARPE
ncbi:MAG: nucleotidyltransferase family protein [Actinomycetota bacterium]|nr:nucleotidyltransferase family protein [Actinomycetota bacterium]